MVGQKLEAVELLANERILSLDVKCLHTIVPILKISKLRRCVFTPVRTDPIKKDQHLSSYSKWHSQTFF